MVGKISSRVPDLVCSGMKKDISEKMTNKNIEEVICKFRSYPNARLRIRQFYFISVIEIGLSWYEHPLLHSPTSKIHQNPETSLWSRGNEIQHSGVWGRDQRTWREGRSSNRIPIRVWTRDVETRSRSQEWSEREGMMGERDSRGFSDLISQEWKLRWRIGV